MSFKIKKKIRTAAEAYGVHLPKHFDPTDPQDGIALVRFDAGGSTGMTPNPVTPMWTDAKKTRMAIVWLLKTSNGLPSWFSKISNIVPLDASIVPSAVNPYFNNLISEELYKTAWIWVWDVDVPKGQKPSRRDLPKMAVPYDAFIDYEPDFQQVTPLRGSIPQSLARLSGVDPTIYLPPND